MQKTIHFGSVCSGIEAASVAWDSLNFKADWLAEIEKFPSQVLAHRFPNTPNLGDMTKLPDMVLNREIPAPDVLVGGTPCFTAGHYVLTKDGYKAIEDIKVGDKVVTHEGRLQKVIRIGSKIAKVGILSAVGQPKGVKCTPEHPFQTVRHEVKYTRNKQGGHNRSESFGEPEWTKAEDSAGLQWCALRQVSDLEYPEFPLSNESEVMYLAGFYLGDGFIRGWSGKNKKSVVFGINPIKMEKLRERVSLHIVETSERTGPRATINNTELSEWLVANFGKGSGDKRIPAWVLSHPNRKDLLNGYLDTDGQLITNGWRANSISYALAYGISDLANTLGFTSSVSKVKTKDKAIIEGREVNQKDYWCVSSYHEASSRKSRIKDNLLLRKINRFSLTGEDEVFNIEVEGDNSYILNGMVVHNCQAFSIAGMRAGLSDPRGALTISYVRLIDAIDQIRSESGQQPGVALWENVPGVLSSSDNAFGTFIGVLAGEDFALEPGVCPNVGKSSKYWRWKKEGQGGKHVPKWPESGCVVGPKRTVVWRTLDAQYFGVAQRRKRVFVVASARDDINPSEILLEFKGMRRDSPPSREPGQDFTHDIAPCLTSSGRGVERCGDTRGQDPVIAVGTDCYNGSITGDIAATMGTSGSSVNAAGPTVMHKPAFTVNRLAWSIRTANTSSNGWGIQKEVTHTLDATQGPAVLMDMPKAFQQNTRDEVRFMNGNGQIAGALAAMHGSKQQNYILEPVWVNGRQTPIHNHGLSGPLDTFGETNVITQVVRDGVFAIHPHCIGRAASSGPQGREYNDTGAGYTMDSTGQSQAVALTDKDIDDSLRVRRLMPVECERLQGFPDTWTLIPVEKGLAKDSPRYKALGNSMAVPVMHWIGNRIRQQIGA